MSTVQSAVDTTTSIQPFQVNIPEAELEDLRRRIAATQLAREGDRRRSVAGRAARDDPEARALLGDRVRLARCEARLNALPQFMTEIDGLDIHFIHVRSQHEDALPLVVNHGWPGSIIEQLKIIEPLTDPTAHGGERGGRLPCGDPVDAGLRVLGQADEHRLGPRAHGPSLGGADAAPRLQPLRRPGRRLGRVRRRPDGRAGTRRTCSPSTPTCLRPFQLTSTRHPWPASRRRPVSLLRNDAPTSS